VTSATVPCIALLLATACGPSQDEIAAVIARGKPLIAAIQAYERASGRPPEALEALLPRYIQELPQTGLESFPQYDYEARSKSPGDWRLNVQVESGRFKHMRFDPKATYEVPVTPLQDGWVMINP
jgi:hypothetical protein